MQYLITVLLVLLRGTMAQADMIEVIKEINPGIEDTQALDIVDSINIYSDVYNIDAGLIAAVIATESKFNVDKTGAKGEIGLMQIRPEYHALFIVPLKERKKFLSEIGPNIGSGVRYLHEMKHQFVKKYKNFSWLEHYNQGPNRRPTKFKYTAKVLSYYKRFKNL